ncbi:MAG: hypothetical protein LBG07_09600 [Treponema sp.]|jgi:hypothetical protein|nr:hypothetical protein [Treponema sp.]
MKGFFAAFLLLCLFPLFVAAQAEEGQTETRTEEWVNTGRFGAEELETEEPEEMARYHSHWLYLGARVGPSLRFYTPSGDTPYTGGGAQGFSVDAAVFATLQIFSRLSLQGEAVFTWDRASSWDYQGQNVQQISRYTKDFSSLSLSFPLTVKWNFYPGNFRLSPFAGVYAMVPLGKMEKKTSIPSNQTTERFSYEISPPLGFLGGLTTALKLGPGMIFADLRYAIDFAEPKPRNGDMESYRRSMISLCLGYEWAFFTKKGGSRE